MSLNLEATDSSYSRLRRHSGTARTNCAVYFLPDSGFLVSGAENPVRDMAASYLGHRAPTCGL